MDSVSLQTIEDPSSGGFFVQYAWTDTVGGVASERGSGQSVSMMGDDAGSHTVTVVATCDGGATQTATVAVNVTPVEVTSVAVSKTSGNMVYSDIYVGDTVTFTPTFNPANRFPTTVS